METMRYQENRKSYKGPIIGFFLFVIIGVALIYVGIKEEKQPIVISGKNKTETQSFIDTEKVNSNMELATISIDIKDKTLNDSENKKLIGDITVPEITIATEALTEINNNIYNDYNDRFVNLKNSMKDAENNFTFKVTYENFDNVINARRILSFSINQRIIDNASKKSTNETITTYNIDVVKKDLVKLDELLLSYLGADYKTKTRDAIKQYLVEKKYISEDEYTYALTGLENYYISDSKIHLVFNSGEIVDSKYGIIDITI